MRLFRTLSGVVAEVDRRFVLLELGWDDIFRADDPLGRVAEAVRAAASGADVLNPAELLPPVGHQEVWAAGVTYYRSRDARMEESGAAGGGDFYARVYQAERPELFFKSSPFRVVGSGQAVRIRRDARWSVPEPELALAVNAAGTIFGYTIGNDMSARDLEGENPLYLPQAKTYDGSCALGPGLLMSSQPLDPQTAITLSISRAGKTAFAGETALAQLKRTPASLVAYLTRETTFPDGVFLMTGTGIIPPSDFTLQEGDEIRIEIAPIGCLTNRVAAS
jgi:2-dehydro-3-deoxy-D-arabinonate dehydratase